MAAGQHAHSLARRQLIDHSSYSLANFEEALRRGNGRGHHVGKNRDDRQIHFWADEVEWHGERVVDAKLVGEREIDTHSRRQVKHVLCHVHLDLGAIRRDTKHPHLMRERPFGFWRFSNQKRWHVVHEKLIEMIARDNDQHVGVQASHSLSHRLIILSRLNNRRLRVWLRYHARKIRAVRDSDDLYKFCHVFPPVWNNFKGSSRSNRSRSSNRFRLRHFFAR